VERIAEILSNMKFEGTMEMGSKFWKSTDPNETSTIIRFYKSFCKDLAIKLSEQLGGI